MELVLMIIWLAIVILFIASFWKIFTKAGEPGWACLVPIYNAIVFLRIAGKPWWWLLLCLIPLVNFVILIMVTISFAKAFGKDVGYAIGLILLGFIFYPMLAFGDATYTKPE